MANLFNSGGGLQNLGLLLGALSNRPGQFENMFNMRLAMDERDERKREATAKEAAAKKVLMPMIEAKEADNGLYQQAPTIADNLFNKIDPNLNVNPATRGPANMQQAPEIADQLFGGVTPKTDTNMFNLMKAVGPENMLNTQMAAMAEARKPVTVADGASVGHYVNGQFVPDFTNEKADKPTAEIQNALFAANGDEAKARSILSQKGINGQWAVRASDGATVFMSDQTLLNAKPGTFLKVPTGMKITSDGQGGFEMVTGDGGGGEGMTNPTKSALEATIVQGTDALARMKGIAAKFKPEYQQLGTRWGNFVAAGKEKLGATLDEATKTNLADYTGYRRDTVANLNQTIKDLTGATVGAQESPRLMQQIPVAGQGMFDGDSPTEFQAKLKGVTDSIAAAVARATYARQNGLTKKQQFAIPLDSVPKMVEAKGNQYRDEIKRANPQMPDGLVAEQVKQKLKAEFGL